MYTFDRGVHPKERKELAEHMPTETMPASALLHVPLIQHIGAPLDLVVEIGQKVKKGQLLASSEKFVSSNVFSPVAGTVKGTEMRVNAMGKPIKHLLIENDFSEETAYLKPLKLDIGSEEIIARLKDCGIVGMGGASFPTHVKFTPPKDKVIDTLIINAAECEPYITCDSRMLIENASKTYEGAKLLQRAIGAKNLFIGIEENKPEGIRELRLLGAPVCVLKTKYPQGAEKQIIYAITKRKVPCGGLPADVGCVVDNIQTAYAAYVAVVEGKPLFERVLTVSGEGIAQPKNILARTGTLYSELLDFCGGFADGKKTVKIVSGGPMMGFAQSDLSAAVTKATSSVLFLTESEIRLDEPTSCINCGNCAAVCPMHLMPMYIDAFALAGNLQEAKRYGALNCMVCGCCSFVCPARRPLMQSVGLAKTKIMENKI